MRNHGVSGTKSTRPMKFTHQDISVSRYAFGVPVTCEAITGQASPAATMVRPAATTPTCSRSGKPSNTRPVSRRARTHRTSATTPSTSGIARAPGRVNAAATPSAVRRAYRRRSSASSAPNDNTRNMLSAYPTCSRNDNGPQLKKKTAHIAAACPARSRTSRCSKKVASRPATIATSGAPRSKGTPVEAVSARMVKGNAGRKAQAFWATLPAASRGRASG